MTILNKIQKASEKPDIDIIKSGRSKDTFVGNPFYMDYNVVRLLTCDAWKNKVKGIPQGAFLLAFYEGEKILKEAFLLRVLRPFDLPESLDNVRSMIAYYKDNRDISKDYEKEDKLDQFTRFEFSFSALECRILGLFYKKDDSQKTVFGADVENFYAPSHYKVYKATGNVLEKIINYQYDEYNIDEKIGKIRYSSSQKFKELTTSTNVYVDKDALLGKRTALFGMTRTGKSNTVKKIIQITSQEKKVGQLIFDINGEYANKNEQDETSIYDLYKEKTERYSVREKRGFKSLRTNFYTNIADGFRFIRESVKQTAGTNLADYVKSFLSIEWKEPDEKKKITNYALKKNIYLCCLYKAGFAPPENHEKVELHLRNGLQKVEWREAVTLLESLSNNWKVDSAHIKYYIEEIQILLIFLTQKKNTKEVSGYSKFSNCKSLHDEKQTNQRKAIVDVLREGKIVIIDLSEGYPSVQKAYSARLCNDIFENAMYNFLRGNENTFIQIYFEEAHNLFPKNNNKNLTNIYDRIAKEGAKLNIGIIYLTQEVSSISSNILKNTQNWFIAHLNNKDEIKELEKYYDFSDFTESLIRFSPSNDVGFVRMKTYKNPFVVPVQIDKFQKDS